MNAGIRVGESVNRALHTVLETDPTVYLLGVDIADPYGGAFKITKGLSTRFPRRVLSTPISESGIVGVANGLALTGNRAIVEIMFGDFVLLAFDQLVNLAAKSTSMYGRPLPVPLMVRCPVGGGRGYGPTHSQSPQKHLIGTPGLTLHELTPFHEPQDVLTNLLGTGVPAVFFEDKRLYTERVYRDGVIDALFRFELVGGADGWARVRMNVEGPPDCVVITHGGLTSRALTAARELLVARELSSEILIPSRLYPCDLTPVQDVLRRAEVVCVAEEGAAGGTWGDSLAGEIYRLTWGRLRRPLVFAHSAAAVIPAAPHLERRVLVGSGTIRRAVEEAIT